MSDLLVPVRSLLDVARMAVDPPPTVEVRVRRWPQNTQMVDVRAEVEDGGGVVHSARWVVPVADWQMALYIAAADARGTLPVFGESGGRLRAALEVPCE